MPDTYSPRVIESLKRLRLSTNGNPRFVVTFTDGSSAQTQTDAGFAYGLDSREYVGVPVLVAFSRAGRITDVKKMRYMV